MYVYNMFVINTNNNVWFQRAEYTDITLTYTTCWYRSIGAIWAIYYYYNIYMKIIFFVQFREI